MLFHKKIYLLFTLFMYVILQSYAHVPLNDSVKTKDKKYLTPNYVAMMSTVLPGSGQVYNGQWWKVPIVYGGLGVIAYFVYQNNQDYLTYKNAYYTRVHPENNPDNTPTKFDIFDERNPSAYPKYNNPNTILALRENSKRNRDLSIIGFVAAYAAQSIDAYVFAHLRKFDVSDNLSMRISTPQVWVVNSKPFYITSLTFTF